MWLYGISSRAPFFYRNRIGDKNVKVQKHYLLIDVDDESLLAATATIQELYKLAPAVLHHKMWVEHTPNGWHIICFYPQSLRATYSILRQLTFCDKTYAKTGYKRGYWFLVTYKKLPKYLLEKVEPMKIFVPDNSQWLGDKNAEAHAAA